VTNRPTATLVALFLAALTLRPQIVGIGPLIPSIQDAFGT
jgi:cyanate permease